MLKPGGLFLLGVPTDGPPYNTDTVFYNVHRHYGKARIAHMAANYDFIEVFSNSKVRNAAEIFVLRKPLDSENKLYVE